MDQSLHRSLGTADETALHHGVPMLANRANTFIFNQLSSEFTRIREQFPTLPEAIVQTLPNLGQGSCVAEIGKDLLFLDVIASPLEQTALSSKATDRDRMRRLIEQLIAEHRALAAATPEKEKHHGNPK